MKLMNCVSFEPLVALFVEGDLSETDRLRVEKHLESCSSCGALLIELEESQAAFKSLRQGVVNSGALSEVRERVLNDVGDIDPAPAWVVAVHRMVFAGLRRRTAIAGVAVGMLLLGGVWLGLQGWTHHDAQPSLEPASPVEIATVNEPPVNLDVKLDVKEDETFVKPVTAAKPRKRRARVEEPDNRIATQTDTVQFPIKFVTDDPNIIIYWLPSDKGD